MKKRTAILAAFLLAAGLCACGSSDESIASPPEDTSGTVSEAEEEEQQEEPSTVAQSLNESTVLADAAVTAERIPVRIMGVKGVGSFGIAGLIGDAVNGKTSMDYQVSVGSDAEAVCEALKEGSCDIALIPSDAAARLYNEAGGIAAAAVSTRGYFSLISDTGSVQIEAPEDLEGQTVGLSEGLSSVLAEALFAAADIHVTADTSVGGDRELFQALSEGRTDLAILPEPAAAMACLSVPELEKSFRLNDLWDSVFEPGSMAVNCAVFRTGFAEENPEAAAAFLTEYQSSVSYLMQSPGEATKLIEEYGIFGNAGAALAAIPDCGICCLTGAEMETALGTYLDILAEADPSFIGGEVPGKDFYYTVPVP